MVIHHIGGPCPYRAIHHSIQEQNMRIRGKRMKTNIIGPSELRYVGSNDVPTYPHHLTTVAHRAPVLVDRLEQMLKVFRNPPNVMGEHTPLHACACLDHACRVCLVFRGTYLFASVFTASPSSIPLRSTCLKRVAL